MTICEWCGNDVTDGSTCARSLTCPDCGAKPGTPCKRPSGHTADTLHMARIHAAEAKDAES